jgi:group I intron endonuclease
MKFFIYKITNLINQKIYIGKTNNIKKRWNSHKAAAIAKNKKDFSILHKALLKYGFENFKIESLFEYDSEIEALEQEMFLIATLDSRNREIGYNISAGGDGYSGFKYSEEYKKTMNQEKKITYLGEGNPFYGQHHSDQTKKKLSDLAKERLNNPFYGKTHSPQSIQKMKENHHAKSKYFSETEAEEIRYKRNILKMKYKELSLEYGVSIATLKNIVFQRKAYAKVTTISNVESSLVSPDKL